MKMPDSQLKCKTCNTLKSLLEFHIDRAYKSGRHPHCKPCYSKIRKAIRHNGYGHYKNYAMSRYTKYKRDWLEFFENYYGLEPKCEICSTSLVWQTNIGKFQHDVVCWDHRSCASAQLKTPPSAWIGSHACNQNNIEKWFSFDLGILCCRCNGFLPTMDRIEWLTKALEYVTQDSVRLEIDG